jgi:UDP-N-acetylmuramoyl-tripeptide--D-alanyl-D-alanine ligase
MIYILILGLFIFSIFRLRLLMLFFQQKEYNAKWFIKFVFSEKWRLVDKRLTITILLLFFLGRQISQQTLLSLSLLPIFAISVFFEERFIARAKKKMVVTQRAKRILGTTLFLVAIGIGITIYTKVNLFVSSIIIIQLLPFLLMGGNLILEPLEKNIQKKFLNEAKEKLAKLNPIVIGITGSYGKTSTKHILAHILSGNLPILFTPRSINTEMGVTRVIRESLTDEHKYFVIEIGAYFKGSIEKMCKFVKPKHGIITSIGQAHYEYFKTQETIAAAKFELGEWINGNNNDGKGILVVNTNQIEEYLIPNMPMIKVGRGSNIYVSDIKQTKDGISLKFHNKEEEYQVEAPVYGIHQANNIAIAIEMALQLGMSMNTILATLKTLPQTNHRLEVLKREGSYTIIDNAYNSNSEGFKSGLELLQTLNEGRRILVTPGMVELGKIHDSAHYEIGKIAGKSVDIAIIVASRRIPTFIKGFKETANKNTTQLLEVPSFADAQKWLNENAGRGDVVLLENDLPDVYESEFSL